MRTLLSALVLLMFAATVQAQEPGRSGDANAPAAEGDAESSDDEDTDEPEVDLDAPVEPSDNQRTLLEQADAAFAAQNPALARSLLQQVVDEAPLRSVYLRLAASAIEAGACLAGDDYLQSADAAPPDAPEATLDASRARAQASLEGRCGKFEPSCLPGNIVLALAEGQQRPCLEKPFWLAPGKRTIFFDFEAKTPTRVEINIVQGQTLRSTLIGASERRAAVSEASIYLSDALPLDIAKTRPVVKTEIDLEGPGTLRIAGWSLLGAGAVATVAGVVFAIELGGANEDAAALAATDRFDARKADRALDDARFFETAEVTSYSLAAGFLITGGILLWIGSDEPETAIAPVLGPGTAGAVWTVQWQ